MSGQRIDERIELCCSYCNKYTFKFRHCIEINEIGIGNKFQKVLFSFLFWDFSNQHELVVDDELATSECTCGRTRQTFGCLFTCPQNRSILSFLLFFCYNHYQENPVDGRSLLVNLGFKNQVSSCWTNKLFCLQLVRRLQDDCLHRIGNSGGCQCDHVVCRDTSCIHTETTVLSIGCLLDKIEWIHGGKLGTMFVRQCYSFLFS